MNDPYNATRVTNELAARILADAEIIELKPDGTVVMFSKSLAELHVAWTKPSPTPDAE